jgi:hypothetical protein
LKCVIDKGYVFAVRVLLHASVWAVGILVDEFEGECVVGHEGRVAESEPEIYGYEFSSISGGVEVTRTLREVLEEGWVAAAPRGAGPPFLEPSV